MVRLMVNVQAYEEECCREGHRMRVVWNGCSDDHTVARCTQPNDSAGRQDVAEVILGEVANAFGGGSVWNSALQQLQVHVRDLRRADLPQASCATSALPSEAFSLE